MCDLLRFGERYKNPVLFLYGKTFVYVCLRAKACNDMVNLPKKQAVHLEIVCANEKTHRQK